MMSILFWMVCVRSRGRCMDVCYRKAVTASSTAEGSDPVNTVDEDCRRWWSAGSDQPGEWLCVDLGRDYDVRAIQVIFRYFYYNKNVYRVLFV